MKTKYVWTRHNLPAFYGEGVFKETCYIEPFEITVYSTGAWSICSPSGASANANGIEQCAVQTTALAKRRAIFVYEAMFGEIKDVPALELQNKNLNESLNSWKDAWYHQREIIGNQAWHHPAIHDDDAREYYKNAILKNK